MLIEQTNNQIQSTRAVDGASPVVAHQSRPTTDKQALPENAKAPVETQANLAIEKVQVNDAVDKANKAIHMLANNLQFSVDESTGRNIVKVVDNETKELIRQIPTEEMLDIAKRLDDLQGLLIRQKA